MRFPSESDLTGEFGVSRATVRTAASKSVSTSLDVLLGQAVLTVEVIFTTNNVPVIFCINRLLLWVLGEALVQEVLAQPDLIEPIYDFLEASCGQRWSSTMQPNSGWNGPRSGRRLCRTLTDLPACS